MSINCYCPHCGIDLKVKDRVIGSTVSCPNCGHKFTAKAEDDTDKGNGSDWEPPDMDDSLFGFVKPAPHVSETLYQSDALIGSVLMAAGGLIALGSLLVGFLYGGWLWCGLVSGFGSYLFVLGGRYRARSAADLMRQDPRRPILYLRAFKDDDNPRLAAKAGGLFWVFTAGGKRSFEGVVRRIFSAVGPVIAIGRPGDRMPSEEGKTWVSFAGWQEKVRELVRDCRLVVMVLGPTTGKDGLSWEVRTLFRMRTPKKLVLIVPPVPEAEVKARWEKYREITHGRLPPYQGGELFALFTRDWECAVTRTRWWRTEQVYYDKVAVWETV